MDSDLAAWKAEVEGGVNRPTAFIVQRDEQAAPPVPEAEQVEDVWQAWTSDPSNLL